MKTIYEQTGWKRPYPLAICQDMDALLKVTDFYYDIYDDGFMRYFRARTGIQVFSEVDDELILPIDREDDKKHVKLIRAKLQDCWELYCTDKGIDPDPDDEEVPKPETDTVDLFEI